MKKLTEIIRLRVSAQMYKQIASAASQANRTVSDWVRLTVAHSMNGKAK